ncbi:unnamed protein product [Cylindrotheca closterium]|uniref:Kinesin light chain n=1 Tax=Cylindrotheca closterium TaxID=2856 RepID=A0AAD2JKJ9_9STRA|nr:unnamed protein product [Cylindrotheca closterium]
MNIGQIFHEQQKDEEAEEMFQKAMEIKREILPHNHPEVMGLYVHLVHSLKKQCKYSEAQKMQRLQLATLLELHGEDHYDVVNAYNGIASLLVCQNMLDDALQMVDRGIDICNRLERLGDRTIDVMGGTLRHKADILYEQGNMEAAADILNKVIMMMQIDTADAMHPAIAEMCEDLALKYYKHGIVEGAINAYEKAIKIRRKEFGNDHPHTKKLKLALKALACESDVRKLNELGLEMKAKGDSERAIQLFQEALGIDKSNIYAIGDTNASFLVRAAVYENISSVKVDQGLLEDAIAASAEALKIRRRTLGDDHCDTKRQMETHRSLLRRLLENRG